MVALEIETMTSDHELIERLAGIPHREGYQLASELEVDHTYQRRSIREAWVKQIAENFDPELFRPLLVNRRRIGSVVRYFVMDGQHRLLALRRMGWGDQFVPCVIYDDLSLATEAKLFDTQGATRPLTAAERFRSRLERREPDETLVDALVRQAGYQINLDTGDMSEGRIPGVQSLLAILHRHGSDVLRETLAVCAEGFGVDTGPRGSLLSGLALFLARYRRDEHFDHRQLVRRLRTKTMGTLVAEGREATKPLGRSLTDGIAYEVYKTYNYRLTEKGKLSDWSFGRQSRRP